MDNIITPRFPPQRKIKREAQALPGYRYQLDLTAAELAEYAELLGNREHCLHSGLLADYSLDLEAAFLQALDVAAQPIAGFVWNADLLPARMQRSLKSSGQRGFSADRNSLIIRECGLPEPEIRLIDKQTVLTASPYFKLQWHTKAFASQLGFIQLVEASRSLQFADGTTLNLLDTEAAGDAPVLYLRNSGVNSAVEQICGFQARDSEQAINFETNVTQNIPTHVDEKPVVSLTVLEKYSAYFMQNAAPEDRENHIWTPVHLPISWGWSIRVQRRFDGVWDIFRKKLIFPTPSTEAPTLPSWQSNTLLCSLFQPEPKEYANR